MCSQTASSAGQCDIPDIGQRSNLSKCWSDTVQCRTPDGHAAISHNSQASLQMPTPHPLPVSQSPSARTPVPSGGSVARGFHCWKRGLCSSPVVTFPASGIFPPFLVSSTFPFLQALICQQTGQTSLSLNKPDRPGPAQLLNWGLQARSWLCTTARALAGRTLVPALRPDSSCLMTS